VTLNDLELRNGCVALRHFAEFASFWGLLRKSVSQPYI